LALTDTMRGHKICVKRGILPGMRELIRRIGDDERRHMAWGSFTCRRHVAADDANWAVFETRMNELIPLALRNTEESSRLYGMTSPSTSPWTSSCNTHPAGDAAVRTISSARRPAIGDIDLDYSPVHLEEPSPTRTSRPWRWQRVDDEKPQTRSVRPSKVATAHGGPLRRSDRHRLAGQSLCPDWNVRRVVNHVTSVEAVLAGWPSRRTPRHCLPCRRPQTLNARPAALDNVPSANGSARAYDRRRDDLAALTAADLERPSWTPVGPGTYGRIHGNTGLRLLGPRTRHHPTPLGRRDDAQPASPPRSR